MKQWCVTIKNPAWAAPKTIGFGCEGEPSAQLILASCVAKGDNSDPFFLTDPRTKLSWEPGHSLWCVTAAHPDHKPFVTHSHMPTNRPVGDTAWALKWLESFGHVVSSKPGEVIGEAYLPWLHDSRTVVSVERLCQPGVTYS